MGSASNTLSTTPTIGRVGGSYWAQTEQQCWQQSQATGPGVPVMGEDLKVAEVEHQVEHRQQSTCCRGVAGKSIQTEAADESRSRSRSRTDRREVVSVGMHVLMEDGDRKEAASVPSSFRPHPYPY